MENLSKQQIKTNLNLYFYLVVIFLFTQQIEKVQGVCQSQCNSCGTGAIWNYAYTQHRGATYYQNCLTCISDPNRNTSPATCICDYGYYFDGTNCVLQKMGTIYHEDFESPTCMTDNWAKNDIQPQHYGVRTTEPFTTTNVCTFTGKNSAGDIFYKKYYQSYKYDERVHISFDYKDELTDNQCELWYGITPLGSNAGHHRWYLGTGTSGGVITIENRGQQWGHLSYMMDTEMFYDVPFTIMFEDGGTPGTPTSPTNRCYIDNVKISSSHGPDGVNVSAFHPTHPTFMILSIDQTGYDGNLNDQQFNFKVQTINDILGRTDWNGEKFALYSEEHLEILEVNLYNTSNGGIFGDGHGKFVSNTGRTAKRWFNIGKHLVFDNHYATITADFVLKTGGNSVKDFDGPYKADLQNLAGCYDDCRDYETFWEAVRACRLSSDCEGVKYAHKNWGGTNSQGFIGGYGYQLRKIGSESHLLYREFEFSYVKNNVTTSRCIDCEDNCSECGTKIIKDYTYLHPYVLYKECTKCDMSDPNRINQLPDCPCKKGYFYDGTICQQHKVGIVYQDDFSNADMTINWIGQRGARGEFMSTVTASIYGNPECIQYTEQVSGGDIFWKKKYQTLQYDEGVWISFDYVSEGNANIVYGYSTHNNGNHDWQYSQTPGPGVTLPEAIPYTTQWSHFEAKHTIYYDIPFRTIFEDATPNQALYMDNFILSSTHGPEEINKSPYTNLQPGFMILSNDYNGFDGSASSNQQFNFNIADLEAQIGRSLVNGEKFAGYIEGKKITEVFQIFTTANSGQSIGDGYGKFDDAASFTDKIYFQPGDWIILANDLTSNKNDFILQSETCMFNGPFRGEDQDMEGCFMDCIDFETLEEAMKICLENINCEAVSYSHRYWGGSKTQGFHNGYGFQLRIAGVTSTIDFDRRFEYTYKKKPIITGKYQKGLNIICSDCNTIFCENCATFPQNCLSCSNAGRQNEPTCTCIAGTFHDGTAVCKACSYKCDQCVGTDDTCTVCSDASRDINTNCECLPGNFNQGSNPVCQTCIHPCINCQNSNQECLSCVVQPFRQNNPPNCSCQEGYFENGSNNCQKCDLKCKSCSITSDGCSECFDDNRDQSKNCQCKNGYFDAGQNSCLQCDKKCSSCSSLPGNCTSCPDTRQGFPVCSCQVGYFEIYEKECQKCEYPCFTCTSDNLCLVCLDNKRQAPYCDCKDGYYDAGEEMGGCQLCDQKCISCSKSADNCTSCSYSLGRNMNFPNCGCLDDYFETEQKTCEQCSELCSQCQSNPYNCIQCQNPNLLPPLCQQINKGNLLMIEDGIQVVKECSKQCQTCSQSQSNCLTCALGFNRRREAPSCYCLPGFHDENGLLDDCFPCSEYCKDCISQEKCLVCEEGNKRVLNIFNQKCECIQGYKENNLNVCQYCYSYQDVCVFQCPEGTYQDELQQQCVYQNYIVDASNIGLIMIGGIFIVLILLLTFYGIYILTNNLRLKHTIIKQIQPVEPIKNNQQDNKA